MWWTHTRWSGTSVDPKLSNAATLALDDATFAGHPVYVPSICLVELTYLVEKSKVPAIARERLVRALDDGQTPFRLAPLDRAVADALEL